ncbi:unnamed protein product [Orchesella dallaii]|uniref:Uncharacterized protein n=1 Tax=Orchesella dallaii TaxID=48710 RepID=A0ABP1RGZ6_9HEXA
MENMSSLLCGNSGEACFQFKEEKRIFTCVSASSVSRHYCSEAGEACVCVLWDKVCYLYYSSVIIISYCRVVYQKLLTNLLTSDLVIFGFKCAKNKIHSIYDQS